MTEVRDILQANEALDEIAKAHWDDVAAGRSHAYGALVSYARECLRRCGVIRTDEGIVSDALNRRKIRP